MHIYFKLCVFTVCSDDTFSLQECNVNKYVYTDLLIYSGAPNTMISVTLVYCVCVCIYIYIHTHNTYIYTHIHTLYINKMRALVRSGRCGNNDTCAHEFVHSPDV